MQRLPFPYAWVVGTERLAIVVAVTISFALAARALRGVNWSGALAGGISCFLLFACAGPAAFLTLATLFLLTWTSTRVGFGRKQELGIAERRDGRNARQIFANLAVAAVCSVFFSLNGHRAWLVASIAALAEAATDTVASEIGQTTKRTALMITTLKPVASGTDGGVTMSGTLAGTLAGSAVSAVALLGETIPPSQIWIPVSAGCGGMLLDSLLGATCQRRGWVSNEAVNFFGTFAAATLAFGVASLTP